MTALPERPAAALKVESVRFGYGDLTAVWDVSFEAYAGKAVAIIGRNGAGKTTLVSGIAGLLPATAGEVTLHDQMISDVPAWQRARRGLCLVPEGHRVFRDLSVTENLMLGLPRGIRRSERRAAVQQILDRFPILADKRQQHAGSLSGGQQQLLVIASALTSKPSVLLVDEPSCGLAPVAVDQILDLLSGLKSDGIAIVLVEQLVEQVVSGIADDLVVLDQGRVVLHAEAGSVKIEEVERHMFVT